ncbi:RnfH family protein [Paraferrimonas sp. SM1919]|uniref:RnfH family protein n=1 Tax=Paraferrimonas sp. SM1919 TaxID=2662263 RepID=UPI0013D731BC|nr:RnfH family protein [Paraferrimonas sp. SM1919]
MVDKINVEVTYPLPTEQKVFKLQVAVGSTAEHAILASGVMDYYPEIDLEKNKIGIFSRMVKLHEVLQEGQRVEIYRPLIADPKDMRRQRAERAKEQGRINATTGAKIK